MNPEERYIGDAVFVSWDGNMFKLRTGDGNRQVIYLEPSVYEELARYVAEVKALYRAQGSTGTNAPG